MKISWRPKGKNKLNFFNSSNNTSGTFTSNVQNIYFRNVRNYNKSGKNTKTLNFELLLQQTIFVQEIYFKHPGNLLSMFTELHYSGKFLQLCTQPGTWQILTPKLFLKKKTRPHCTPRSLNRLFKGILNSIVGLTSIIGPISMSYIFSKGASQGSFFYIPGAPFLFAGCLFFASLIFIRRFLP